MNAKVAEKLFALVNLLESADTLLDIAKLPIYHLHPMHGDRKGQYALDIVGRKEGHRLLFIPLDEGGNEFEETNTNVIYRSAKIIIIWEVTNHYE